MNSIERRIKGYMEQFRSGGFFAYPSLKMLCGLLNESSKDAKEALKSKNKEGDTLIHLLVRHFQGATDTLTQNIAHLDALLEADLSINEPNNDQNTPLHELVMVRGRGDLKSHIQAMIEKGADLNAINAKGQTPLDRVRALYPDSDYIPLLEP